MNTNTFRPFTEWVSQLGRELRTDPLTRARLRTALIFACFCTVSFSIVGLVVDGYTSSVLASLASGSYTQVLAQQKIEEARWIARIFHTIAISMAVYIFMGLSFRPVQRAIDAQRQFVAKAAHELRTPLAVARTETEVALKNRDALSKEEAVGLVESSLGRLDHLSRIIQFLLVISDLTAPRNQSFNRAVALDEVMRTVEEHARESALKKGVRLTVHCSTETGTVTGNAVALEKLFENLVRNALVHTPSGGSVHLQLEKRGGSALMVSVEDTGCGIPAAERRLVFEPFYRASNAAPNGSGLGLSIVREIARIHRASVELEESVSGGVVARVLFPVRRLSPDA